MKLATFNVCVRLKHAERGHFLTCSPTTVTTPEVKGSGLKEQTFQFDSVQQGSTADLYSCTVQDAVQKVLEGYNACVLAYGATGAGKTHTMFGTLQLATAKEPGIVCLALTDLMQLLVDSEYRLRLSYLEVYNEHVKDLLSDPASVPKELTIMETSTGLLLPDLTSFPVETWQEAAALIALGSSRRTMAETCANQHSTRAHALIQVYLERYERSGTVERLSMAKLSFGDLAGSERLSSTGRRCDRQTEAANINKSLLTLSTCINVLSDPRTKSRFVPYRNSKLTRLLKDSFGGNTLTIFIACVSSCPSVLDSTLQTLRYAQRARSIRNPVTRNIREIDLCEAETSLANALRRELSALRAELRSEFQCVERRSQSHQLQVLLEIHEERVSNRQKVELERQLGTADELARGRIVEDISQMKLAISELRQELRALQETPVSAVDDGEVLELYDIVKKLHLEKLLLSLKSLNSTPEKHSSSPAPRPHRSVTPPLRTISPIKSAEKSKRGVKVGSKGPKVRAVKPQEYASIERIRSQILRKLKGNTYVQ